VIDSDFDLNFELKQIENAEHKKFRQCSAYEMHGNYIFTENGTIIYTYIIKNVVDNIIKRPSRKISNKISITKSFGSHKIKEVYIDLREQFSIHSRTQPPQLKTSFTF
jgi:hypothetical protein